MENCAEVTGQLHIRGITEKHAAITKTGININTHLGEFAMHFLEEACPFGRPEKNLNLSEGVGPLEHILVIPRHPAIGL